MGNAEARQADAKGRVTLGKEYANRMLLIEEREGEVVIRLARVVPEDEAWLYENEEAIGALRRGLKQARDRRFGAGPDLAAASELADQLQDD